LRVLEKPDQTTIAGSYRCAAILLEVPFDREALGSQSEEKPASRLTMQRETHCSQIGNDRQINVAAASCSIFQYSCGILKQLISRSESGPPSDLLAQAATTSDEYADEDAVLLKRYPVPADQWSPFVKPDRSTSMTKHDDTQRNQLLMMNDEATAEP
jgi:hypothetical protein